MRGLRPAFPVIFLFLTILAPLSAVAAEKGVIIGFHEQPGFAEHAFLRSCGGKIKRPLTTIRAIATRIPADAMARIMANPKIAYIEDDATTTLVEPLSGSVEQGNSWGVARVGALESHAQGNFGQGVRIAVLDTGIDATHPELAASYRGGVNLIAPDLTEPLDDSWNGHGTHVAGIISAAADGIGVVGVAPAAELYAVKVVDGGGFGEVSDLIAGLEWAIANQIDIVNISLGTKASSLALEQACQAAYQAGVLLVAAAGNTQNDGGAVLYPAAYEQVIAVSATARDDSPVWISATGPQIELAAPGGIILSTVPGGGYAVLTGTSQAAPHVAGVAALQMAAGIEDLDGNGTTDCRDVRLQLRQMALDLGETGVDTTFGYGLALATASAPIKLQLIRHQGRSTESSMRIDLAAGNYEISIANGSLSRVQIEVADQTGLRADLSATARFQPKSPAEAIFSLTGGNGGFSVIFVPEGPVNGFADIVIRKR